MKKTILAALILATLCAAPLSAQFLGHLRTAQTSGLGSLNLQTAAGIYEDAFTVMGRMRYGIANRADMTLSLALLDPDNSDNLEIVLGSDLMFQVSDYDLGRMADMALGAFVEYYSMDRGPKLDYSNLAIGVSYVIDRPIELAPAVDLVPYGKVNLRVNRVEVNDKSESDFNIGFNLGAVMPVSGRIDVSGEVQLDDQFGFVVGVNFLMW